MTEHHLKTWPEHFEPLQWGKKTCELRLDDRGYQVGDILELAEWEPSTERFTGYAIRRRVTHILRGKPWLTEGYVAMSLAPAQEPQNAT